MSKDISTNAPLISFVVPYFNDSETVKRTLQSCISSLTEVLVVDDASQPAELKALQDIVSGLSASENADIALTIHEENQGLGKTRNSGVTKANSDSSFFYFLDSDDWLVPNALSKLENEQKQSGCEVVVGQITTFDGTRYYPHKYNSEFLSQELTLKSIDEFPELLLMPTLCSKIISKDLIEREGFEFAPERYYAEDLHMSVRTFLTAKGIKIIPEPVVNFTDLGKNRTKKSLWNTDNELRAVNTLKSCVDLIQWLDDNNYKKHRALLLYHSIYRLPRALRIMANKGENEWTDFATRVSQWLNANYGTDVLPNLLQTPRLTRVPSFLSVACMQLIFEQRFSEAQRLLTQDTPDKKRELLLTTLKNHPLVIFDGVNSKVLDSTVLNRCVNRVDKNNDTAVLPAMSGSINRAKQLAYLGCLKQTNLFDKEHYLSQTSSIMAKLSPSIHYLLVGEQAGLTPNQFFSPSSYYKQRRDVYSAKQSAFGHFCKFGLLEL